MLTSDTPGHILVRASGMRSDGLGPSINTNTKTSRVYVVRNVVFVVAGRRAREAITSVTALEVGLRRVHFSETIRPGRREF